MFLISVPMCIYFILFAKPSIALLSGSAFENAVFPMQLIMPTLIFIGITNIIGLQMLVPLGREKQVLCSEIAGAIVNIIVNSLLIPRMGAAGAAIGTVLAEFAVLCVQVAAMREQILLVLRKISYLKIALAVVIGSLCSLWVIHFSSNAFFCLAVSAVLFFGSYGIVLIITREKTVIEIVDQIFDKIRNFF